MSSTIAAWVVIAALLVFVAVPARAEVVDVSGEIRQVDPPSSLEIEQTVSAERIIVFDERQGVELPFGVEVSLDFPGDGSLVVEEGTVVGSHLLHIDPPESVPEVMLAGSVTFADPIVGFVVTTEELIATDPVLGVSSTQYGVDSDRMLDEGEDSAFITGDPRVLGVRLRTNTALDHLRVLTSEGAVVPGADGSTDPSADPRVQFRGVGGCECDASSAPTQSWPLAIFALVWLGRQRVKRSSLRRRKI